MTEPLTDKLAYRIDEAAKVCGLCRATLYKEIAAGRLRAFKAAGRRLILRDELAGYLLRAAEREAA